MKKLMIASPCHHGKVDNFFTLSLIQSLYILDRNEIQTTVLLPKTGSILAKERNKIISAFMSSDCTHLLMVDNDIGWPGEAPLRFLESEKDIIAGVYPARRNDANDKQFIFLPETNDNGSLKGELSYLKMLGVPAGFLMVSRKAIEQMQEKLPELKYEDVDADNILHKGYIFFNTMLEDGRFWGEDYVFCKNAKKAGLDIWCDPSIVFNHAGTIGGLAEILTNSPPGSKFEYSV